MRLGNQFKPDQARLDFDINYEKLKVLSENESLTSLDVSVEGGDGNLSIDATQITDKIAKAWISGGTAGFTYVVTYVVTTDQGRTHEHCYNLRIRNC